jgi:hypothetical protein
MVELDKQQTADFRASSRKDLRADLGRPPPPAAPMSGRRDDRPCHSKVAGQNHICRCGAGDNHATPSRKLDSSVTVPGTEEP